LTILDKNIKGAVLYFWIAKSTEWLLGHSLKKTKSHGGDL